MMFSRQYTLNVKLSFLNYDGLYSGNILTKHKAPSALFMAVMMDTEDTRQKMDDGQSQRLSISSPQASFNIIISF